MNLTQAVNVLERKYPQELIPLPEKDYLKNSFLPKPNVKYLYRGEGIYPTTKSNYHRLNLPKTEKDYLENFILDLSLELAEKYIGIVDKQDPTYFPRLLAVGAFIQHYGLPIMWLDFTSNLNVAAFFALYNNKAGKGRIWIAETEQLIKQGEVIYNLNWSVSPRPARQNALALRMWDNTPDLQDQNHFRIYKLEFNINNADISKFNDTSLLNTMGDPVSDFIISYIHVNRAKYKLISNRLSKIETDLLNCKLL